jgi:hypothetical protein
MPQVLLSHHEHVEEEKTKCIEAARCQSPNPQRAEDNSLRPTRKYAFGLQQFLHSTVKFDNVMMTIDRKKSHLDLRCMTCVCVGMKTLNISDKHWLETSDIDHLISTRN